MPSADSSSKGKRTDEALYEKCLEEVKNQPNKDVCGPRSLLYDRTKLIQGSGKGQMAAWKSAKAAKLYEERGGSYEAKAGSKNEPTKGKPEAKSSAKV